ncbi:carbohydrate ABC transporter permease [Brevibacterium casei]|uniref:carbohydrate ABC transporter permease n=1 Tax=Brevibacterium casei TaxID=33889 RepID=UPI00223AF9EB|nr:sugar ABC transporter permease [Brevibacterium casei]MCT1550052.1 sugar ABC transporter permease [Brevibacterium casei]MCT1559265.1 sugar ABC transporter permease [Brevibacterium casei]MCT2207998.1 sugar ABC transporter permease [Brevibacterium casei]
MKAQGKTGLVLAAPAVVLIFMLVLVPGGIALAGSFFEISLHQGIQWEWVGTDNYLAIFQDRDVLLSLRNTLIYAVATIVPSLVLGLALALLAHSIGRRRRVVQVLLFLPFAANLVAMAVVFRWIFALHGGFANEVLGVLGIAPINFLGDERYSLLTVAVVGIWRNTSLALLVYLSGLTSVPTAIHEACAADGLTGWRKLTTVLLPLLKPFTTFVVVLLVLQAAQVFDTIDVMTGGGPLGSSETILTMVWRLGMEQLKFGQAAALSTVLLVILVAVGFLRRKQLSGGTP